jgi:hypothetical protein
MGTACKLLLGISEDAGPPGGAVWKDIIKMPFFLRNFCEFLD